MSALSDLTASGATASDTFHISYAQTPGLIAYYTDGYENITTDGIHLTEYGNEIIAGAWLQLFEKIKDGD